DVSFGRDSLDRVTTVFKDALQVAAYKFNGSRVISKEYPGSRSTYKYDAFGRLTNLLHEDDSGSPSEPLAEFTYGYDAGHLAIYQDKEYYNDVSGTRITASPLDKGEQ